MSIQFGKEKAAGKVASNPLARIKHVVLNHNPQPEIPGTPEVPAVLDDDGNVVAPAIPAVPTIPAKDPTISFVVQFFETQEDMDNNNPYHTAEYELDEPTQLQNQLEATLKSHGDFDMAT